eukprot:sb/3465354/
MHCNDCDQEFSSAFDLFDHRARNHTPVVALQPVPSKRQLEENWKDERIDKRPRYTQRKRIDYSAPSPGPPRKRERSLPPRDKSPQSWRDDRIDNKPRHKQRRRIEMSPTPVRRPRSLSPTPRDKSPQNWRDERIDNKPRHKQRRRLDISPTAPTRRRSRSLSPLPRERSRSVDSIKAEDIPLPESPPSSPRGRKREAPESPRPLRRRPTSPRRAISYRLQYYKTKVRSLTSKLAHVQGKVRTLENRYKNKLKECKENLERYQKTVELLQKQREEFETNFNDPKFNAFSAAIINSVTVRDFLRIKDLIAQNKFDEVLRSKKLLTSLQKLFIGMRYGVVPIVVPQRNLLTNADRDIIRGLENVSLERVKSTIGENKEVFAHIFSVIADTINFLEIANQHQDG